MSWTWSEPWYTQRYLYVSSYIFIGTHKILHFLSLSTFFAFYTFFNDIVRNYNSLRCEEFPFFLLFYFFTFGTFFFFITFKEFIRKRYWIAIIIYRVVCESLCCFMYSVFTYSPNLTTTNKIIAFDSLTLKLTMAQPKYMKGTRKKLKKKLTTIMMN